jgi:MFS family permease
MPGSVPRREVGMLFYLTFVTRASSVIVQTVLPIILVSLFSVPPSSVGWVIAGFWIANALGALVAIGVTRNRRISTLVGFAIITVSFLGFVISRSSEILELFVILSGLGLAMEQTFLVPSMHSARSDGRPHSGVGMYSTALSLGLIAGPLIASASLFLEGFGVLFAALAVLSAVTLGVYLFGGYQKSYQRENAFRGILPSQIIKTLKQKGFGSAYSLNFLYSMSLPLFISYAGIYAEERIHLSSFLVLIFFTAAFSLSTVIRVAFSSARTVSFRRALLWGFASLLASFAVLGFCTNVYFLLFAFLLFGVPHALIYPTTAYLALESGGEDGVISATYLFATSSGVAEFISPLMAVPIIALSSLSSMFFITSLIPLVGLIFSLSLRKSIETWKVS